jgi:putative Holliday junction resolvase
MYKALGIDYGLKRTGIAITDALQMIASPLDTIETPLLFEFLQKLFLKEKINVLVVGEARHLDGNASDITLAQQKFCDELTKKFPDKKVIRVDEMFTSKLASQAMLMGGMKKKDRMVKGNLDKISAAIILQSYLENK